MHCITHIILNMSMLYCLVLMQIIVQYSMMNYYILLIYIFYRSNALYYNYNFEYECYIVKC